MELTSENLDDSLHKIGLDKLALQVRDQLLSLAFVYASSHMTLPSVFAQVAIGMYYGYSTAYSAYHSKSEYKIPTGKNSKPLMITDLIGSPRTSPISALAYYVAGSLNDKYRTFFFAEEIYEYIKNPAPHHKKDLISIDKTFIPFCYPNFQYYENKNDPYSRCYQAMYESSFAAAHQKPEHSTQYFYGTNSTGLVERYRVTTTAFGSFHITTETTLSFLEKIQAAFQTRYSIEQIESKMRGLNQRASGEIGDTALETCQKFRVIGYPSEKQATGESSELRSLQITLPDDVELDPMVDFETLVALIAEDKPDRIVFHQQKATDIAQRNALVLAEKINALRAHKELGFELKSLAYHSENPQTAIKQPEHFYSFFSEICTMGYNNPQEPEAQTSITKEISSSEEKKSKKTTLKSKELALQSASHWPQTRVYHIKLQRPPFEWKSVPKTILAMVLHDLVFEIYGGLLTAFKEASRSKNLGNILKIIPLLILGAFSSSKLIIQLSLLPIRLSFSLAAAAYLFYSGKKDNLFEIGPKKNFEAALKADEFAHKDVYEHIYSYNNPMLQMSVAPPERKSQPTTEPSKKRRKRKKKQRPESQVFLSKKSSTQLDRADLLINPAPTLQLSHQFSSGGPGQKSPSTRKKKKKADKSNPAKPVLK